MLPSTRWITTLNTLGLFSTLILISRFFKCVLFIFYKPFIAQMHAWTEHMPLLPTPDSVQLLNASYVKSFLHSPEVCAAASEQCWAPVDTSQTLSWGADRSLFCCNAYACQCLLYINIYSQGFTWLISIHVIDNDFGIVGEKAFGFGPRNSDIFVRLLSKLTLYINYRDWRWFSSGSKGCTIPVRAWQCGGLPSIYVWGETWIFI